ncbi:MAG: hypothetical protein AB7N65_06015 [Vicinamibacterales bacterium]
MESAVNPSQAVTGFVMVGDVLVPVEAVGLAIDLERRGFRQVLDEHGRYAVEPAAGLSESDRSRIARWRVHLGVLVGLAEERQSA